MKQLSQHLKNFKEKNTQVTGSSQIKPFKNYFVASNILMKTFQHYDCEFGHEWSVEEMCESRAIKLESSPRIKSNFASLFGTPLFFRFIGIRAFFGVTGKSTNQSRSGWAGRDCQDPH